MYVQYNNSSLPFPFCSSPLVPDEDKQEADTELTQAMRDIWVNIYDFIDAKAAGTQVKKFKSERALADYTMKTRRVYPKEKAKQGGPVRALLAHIFG